MGEEVVKKQKKRVLSEGDSEKKKAKKAKKEAATEEPVVKEKKKKAKKTDDEDNVAVVVDEKKAKKAKKAKAAVVEEAVAAEPTKEEKKAAKKAKKAAAAAAEVVEEVAEPTKEEKKAAKKAKKAAAAAVEEEVEEAAPVAAAPVVDAGGVKSVFCNNLSWSVDEESLKAHFEGTTVVNIDWISDKDTGKFKGMVVVEFASAADAAKACLTNETELLGRTMYCRLDEKKANNGPKKVHEIKAKPDGCRKLYCGNLSYNIDDAAIKTFFEEAGNVEYIKWVTDRETGDFKGFGFIEFDSTETADAAILKNSEQLMGRAVRLDWAEDKPRPAAW